MIKALTRPKVLRMRPRSSWPSVSRRHTAVVRPTSKRFQNPGEHGGVFVPYQRILWYGCPTIRPTKENRPAMQGRETLMLYGFFMVGGTWIEHVTPSVSRINKVNPTGSF
jgi:hypothetical protein